MSTPELGRNARLFKDGTVIGYAKVISVKVCVGSVWESLLSEKGLSWL